MSQLSVLEVNTFPVPLPAAEALALYQNSFWYTDILSVFLPVIVHHYIVELTLVSVCKEFSLGSADSPFGNPCTPTLQRGFNLRDFALPVISLVNPWWRTIEMSWRMAADFPCSLVLPEIVNSHASLDF